MIARVPDDRLNPFTEAALRVSEELHRLRVSFPENDPIQDRLKPALRAAKELIDLASRREGR